MGLIWWSQNSKPVSSNEQRTRFVIPKGRSASQIGEELVEKGLIRNSLAYKVYVQVTAKAKKIQAGEYTLSPHLSLVQVVDKLTRPPEELWVTIPEGLRREEVVERIIEGLDLTQADTQIFREEFLQESERLEGFLFPDTYLFPRDVKASVVVRKLNDTFDAKTNSLSDEIAESGYSLNQLITLASIIERETKTDEERPIVAGIFYKRIEAGVALQVDATVQYAIANIKCLPRDEVLQGQKSICDNWWPQITRADLEINSPYNTYKFTGIPPGPIANPGISSIEAAINPTDSPYWYYIHDSEGNIHYARSLEEHNQNIKDFLGK